MARPKAFILTWLTIQWAISGPLIAFAGMELFLSDTHGLPNRSAWIALIYLLVVTAGYMQALRLAKSWEDRA